MFAKSIRSKFLLWLAFLLVCLLVGFGVTAFELFHTNQNHQIYEQLQRRLSAVAGDLSSSARGRPPGRFGRPERGMSENEPYLKPRLETEACSTNSADKEPFTNNAAAGSPRSRHSHFDDFHDDDFDSPKSHGRHGPEREPASDLAPTRFEPGNPAALLTELSTVKLTPDVLDLFDQADAKGFYFVVWNSAGIERLRSSNAPALLEIVAPVARGGGPQIRMHGEYMESYLQHVIGYRILTGRSIAPELTTRREFALWLIAAGLVVLAIGLCGGWWLTGRALRPLTNISAAASRISAGNLSQRINVSETDNELGQLAGTLNSTFARLESAFTQQQQFTADASHELRTPLAVMISEAQTTLARKRTEAEYRETVETCLSTAQQMRRLTESLLELARYDSGQENLQRAPFDLADILRECSELLRPLAAERNVQLDSNFAPAPTSGDADRIRQVVINLVSNAIYYNKPDGHVRISTQTVNSEVTLVIADNGIGIPAADLPNVFKRFYRADKARSRSNGNSGLGLAICKAIVDAHGGQINVTSKPGEGSTFTLTLPAMIPA